MSYRIAVRFAVDGDLRFLSHQDSMRLFERAAVRARLPLRWSQGFNPRPRFSLPLPRPVGVASEDELLVLVLDEPADGAARLEPSEVLDRLAAQTPDGVRLLGSAEIDRMPRPRRVRYGVDVPAGLAGDDLAGRVEQLLARGECVLPRRLDERGHTRPIDIRPFIDQLQWNRQSARLTMALRLADEGTARPGEVLGALGLDAGELGHRVVREQVDWQIEWNTVSARKGV